MVEGNNILCHCMYRTAFQLYCDGCYISIRYSTIQIYTNSLFSLHELLNSKPSWCLLFLHRRCVHKFKLCFQSWRSKLSSAPVFKTKQLYLPQTKNK